MIISFLSQGNECVTAIIVTIICIASLFPLFGDYSPLYHLLLARTDIFGDNGDGDDYRSDDVNHRNRSRHRQYRNIHEDEDVVAVVDFDLDVFVFSFFFLLTIVKTSNDDDDDDDDVE